MKQAILPLLGILLLAFPARGQAKLNPAAAFGGSVYRVKYAGGSQNSLAKAKKMLLRGSSDSILIGPDVIPAASVTLLTLTDTSHHRIADGALFTLSGSTLGPAMMFSRETKYFFSIQWGEGAAASNIAFQADKRQYRDIARELEAATGKKLSAAEEEPSQGFKWK